MNPTNGFPVYYETLKLLSKKEVKNLNYDANIKKFPRVEIKKFGTRTFRVLNYHKHISRVFESTVFSKKKYDQMNEKNYFLLFSNLKFVKGTIRIIIIDQHNSDVDLIPNFCYDFATIYNKLKVSDILANYPSGNARAKEILEFFLERNYAFLGSSDQRSMVLSDEVEFHTPNLIENGIIDYSSKFNLEKALHEFHKISCPNIQIRVFSTFSGNNILLDLIDSFKTLGSSPVRHIEIFLPYITEHNFNLSLKKLANNSRVRLVVIYNSPANKNNIVNDCKIFWIKDPPISEKSCGKIGMGYFAINPSAVNEAYSYNSCLNRKISIDSGGFIKNCPSMSESFGNIRDTTLSEAIEKPGFRKYWNINKDQIHVCKDCEFRYICTDCRAYVEDPKDILSKPLKCGYNPYTGEWSDWSTNPLKQKAIDYYGMRDLLDLEGAAE